MDPTPQQLDEAQRAAVESEAPALLVVAGPGSGKTRVLTHRIAWRAEIESMQPRHAVAVTFTRRAAQELRSRLRQLGMTAMGPVGTFHSIALAQVRRYDLDRGRSERSILPNRAALSGELSEHLQRHFGHRPPVTVAVALREIDWAKANDLSVAEYREGPGARRLGKHAGAAAAELYGNFERVKSRKRMLDFDDLLAECTRLMTTDEHFAAAQRWLGRHFFVDEFQDLNRLQWNLLCAWLGGAESVRNGASDICAVGDVNQAIYGWNGADSRYIAAFEQHFADAQVVQLELNYRSHPSLVAAARSVMANGIAPDDAGAEARGHEQAPARAHDIGPAPTVTAYDDPAGEAAGIAGWIAEHRVGGTRWDAFGVLARTNAQLHDIATALQARGIPYRLSGQRSQFLGLPAVRELLDQFRAAGSDFPAAVADLRFDARHQSADAAPDSLAQQRLVELGVSYLSELGSLDADQSARRGPNGEGFANWLRLLTGSDRELTADIIDSDRFGAPLDARDGTVALATFHAAKGLQWRFVVVAGAEDGLVPLRHDDPEERRLFYVAVSRASRYLHFTWARHRSVRGASGDLRNPSPWLELIEHATAEPPPLSLGDAASHVRAARAALDAAKQQ